MMVPLLVWGNYHVTLNAHIFDTTLVVSPVQHHIGNFCFQTVEHRISGSVREVQV